MKENILKRIILIILAGFICTQSIFAEGMINIDTMTDINMGQTITTITVGNVETIEGNEITVPVSISNNVGLVGLTLSVEYDCDVLTLTRIVRGEALSSLSLTKPGDLTLNPFKLLWDGTNADSTNGSIVSLEFTIVDGTQHTEDLIDVSVVDACDNDMEDVETVVNKGSLSSNFETDNINSDEPASKNSNRTVQTNQMSDLSVKSNIESNGITITVSKPSIDDKIIAVLATYESDGKLYEVEIYDITANQESNSKLTYQFKPQERSGKLMFWNTEKNLMPIRASMDFTQNSGINAYYYDADNRLLQIDKADGKSLHFTYDNMGNLLSKTINGGEEDA